MRVLFKDLKKSIRERGHWYFILFFLLVLSTFFFSIVLSVLNQQKEVKRNYDKTYVELQYYSLLDSLVGKKEQEVYQNPLSVMQLKRLNEELRDEDCFTYLEIYNNAVYIKEYSGELENLQGYETNDYENNHNIEIFGEGTGLYSAVKGMWLGANVAEHFGLRLSEGTFPEKQEYLWNEKGTVKVVLGAGYRGTYQLGEKFWLDFYVGNKEAEVVGFLEKGEVLSHRGVIINLDHYLLLPQYDMEQLSTEVDSKEYHTFWFLYLMKNNGMIASYSSAERVQSKIDSLCEKVGLPSLYLVSEADDRQTITLGENMEELIKILFAVSMGGLVLSILLLCIHSTLRIKTNTRYYAILCSCGYSVRKILGMVLAELVVLLLLSVVVGYLFAVLVAALFSVEPPKLYLAILFVLVYGIAPFLVSFYRLYHMEPTKGLREE